MANPPENIAFTLGTDPSDALTPSDVLDTSDSPAAQAGVAPLPQSPASDITSQDTYEVILDLFDMDGAVLPSYDQTDPHPYVCETHDDHVIEYNARLLELFTTDDGGIAPKYHYCGSGSARTDLLMDISNSVFAANEERYSISSFIALEKLTEGIRARRSNKTNVLTSKLLLPDLVHNNVKIGTTFDLSIEWIRAKRKKHEAEPGAMLALLKEICQGGRKRLPPLKHRRAYYDESKVALIYANMHYIAQEHPGEQLLIRFTDDRVNILNNLCLFYSDHSELLPPNVTLELYEYEPLLSDSHEPKFVKEIKSSKNNLLDTKFKFTVRDMGEIITTPGSQLYSVYETLRDPQKYNTLVAKRAHRIKVDDLVTASSSKANLSAITNKNVQLALAIGLITVGVVLVVASILILLESFGISTPLSTLGIKIGTTALIKGFAIAGIVAGFTGIGYGAKYAYGYTKAAPLKTMAASPVYPTAALLTSP